jgi:hypothetical protein
MQSRKVSPKLLSGQSRNWFLLKEKMFSNRFSLRICISAVFVLSVFGFPHVSKISALNVSKSYKDCMSMRSAFNPWGISNGVALNSQAVGYTGAIVDPALFQENKHLDTDRDGVACEGKIFDLGVTSSTPGVAAAYSACKSERAADQIFVNISSQLERYYTTSDTFLAIIPMHEQAYKQMQIAASQNAIFKDAAKSAKYNLDVLKKSYLYALKGKSLTGGTSNLDSDNWCALFGVYSGHKGMFPPIEMKFPKIAKTPVNGARQVCQSLFVIAPRGELLYSGNDSISLNDCDRNARNIGLSSNSYLDAMDQMIEIYFSRYDYWCWGRNNCITEWDIK